VVESDSVRAVGSGRRSFGAGEPGPAPRRRGGSAASKSHGSSLLAGPTASIGCGRDRGKRYGIHEWCAKIGSTNSGLSSPASSPALVGEAKNFWESWSASARFY